MQKIIEQVAAFLTSASSNLTVDVTGDNTTMILTLTNDDPNQPQPHEQLVLHITQCEIG